jgi:hypothetical protein
MLPLKALKLKLYMSGLSTFSYTLHTLSIPKPYLSYGTGYTLSRPFDTKRIPFDAPSIYLRMIFDLKIEEDTQYITGYTVICKEQSLLSYHTDNI